MLLTLDLGAVLAISALLSAVATLLLLTTWRAAGRPAYLAAWAGFCGLGTAAFALHALRGPLPGPPTDAILMLLATPAYVLAWTLFWIGCRRLRGAAEPRWLALLPVGLWYLACTLPAFQAQLELRVIAVAGLIGLLSLAGATEALRLRGSMGLRRAALPLGLLNLLLGAVLLGRIMAHLAGHALPYGGLIFLFGALLSIATGFAGLALASIQAAEGDAARVAGAAQREAAALAAGRDEVLRLHGALPALVFLRDVAADGTARLLYRGGDIEAVTGWSEAALAGLADLDSLNAPDVPTLPEFLRQTLRDGAWLNDWRMRRPDGTLQWMRTHARCLTRRPDGGAEVVGYILNVDAEHRAAAAAETALLAGRAEVERLHAGLPAMIFLRAVAPDGTSRRLYRGGDIAAVTGWPAADILALEDLDALHAPETPALSHALRETLRTGSWLQDWQMRQPDGSLHWMRTRIRRLVQAPDGSGEVAGYVLNVEAEYRATAEQRAAEAREAATARAAQAQLERLHAGLPALVFHRVVEPDGTSRLLYRGGDHLAVTGWPADAFPAAGYFKDYAEPGIRPFAEHLRDVLRDGSGSVDWRMRQPDGSWRWMRNVGRRLTLRPDGGGEVVGYVLDIQAEREATAAAADLERTLGLAPVIVFRGRIAPDGGLTRTYLSRGIEAVTGWPWEQINPRGGLLGIVDPAHQGGQRDQMLGLLRKGHGSVDVRMRHADGRWLWLRATAAVVERLPDGGAEMICFLTDVTAERAAATAVADLDRTLAATPMVVYRARIEADGDLTRTYLSRGIEQLTGWPWADFQDNPGKLRSIMEFDSEAHYATTYSAMRQGKVEVEMRLRCADGRRIWVRQTALSVALESDASEVVGFIVDISEERAAREREAAALQAGRDQMERLLTGVPAVLFHRDCDADGTSRLLYRGGDMATVTGWPPEVLAAFDNLAEMREDPVAESEMLYHRVLRADGQALDWRMRQPDGSARWMRSHARLLSRRPDGGGEIVGYVLDVSAEYAAAAAAEAARAREAAALLEGRAEIERLHAGVPVVIFLRDSKPDGTSRLLYRGGDIEAVTGWPAAELAGTDDLTSLRYDPEGSLDTVPTRLLQHGAVTVDWRMCQPDGPPRWMRTRGRVLSPRPDGGGEVVGYILDVSAEYAAAEAVEAGRAREAAALLAGRAEVERLLAGLPAIIFLRDVQPDGASRLVYRTGDVTGVTGWPAETLAAQETWRHLAGPDAPDFPAAYRTALQTGEATMEWRLRRPDGSLQWMRSYGARLSLRPDGSGEVAGYMLNIDRERTAESELETVLQAAPLAVYRGRVTAEGGFIRTYMSRGIERVTGWPWEAVNPPGGMGRIIDPANLDVQPEHVRAMLAQGVHIRDLRMRRPDDSWIWTRHTVVPLAPDGAGGAEVVGFIVDVTAEREAMARELEARAELDRTLAAAPVAVLRGRISPGGRLRRTFLSRGIEQVTGWAWETVNQRGGLSRIIEPASRAALPDRLRQLLRDGTIRYDHRLRRADGAWADVRSTLSVLDRLADGSVEVVGFMADVTAERAAQAQAAAAGRLAALGEMGTGLAHELKQPLATISLAAENALRSVRRGEAAAAVPRLERITAQAQRAAGIIENLRRFARGSEPGAPPVAVPVGQAVDSALALVGGPLREAGIEVERAFGAPMPAVLGQLVSLEQVLVNLLVNAADALRALPPGAARRIRVTATAEAAPAGAPGEAPREAREDAMVRLTIGDTGGGIPEAILPRLFEPFVSTKDADQGTGLGLSICHGLVKAMGGTIEARNAAEGAVFSILLPRAVEAVGPAA